MTASVQQQVFTTRRNIVHSFYFSGAQLTCTLMSRRRNAAAPFIVRRERDGHGIAIDLELVELLASLGGDRPGIRLVRELHARRNFPHAVTASFFGIRHERTVAKPQGGDEHVAAVGKHLAVLRDAKSAALPHRAHALLEHADAAVLTLKQRLASKRVEVLGDENSLAELPLEQVQRLRDIGIAHEQRLAVHVAAECALTAVNVAAARLRRL